MKAVKGIENTHNLFYSQLQYHKEVHFIIAIVSLCKKIPCNSTITSQGKEATRDVLIAGGV